MYPTTTAKRGDVTTSIAVIGATGTIGSRVIARLRGRDVTVVQIARTYGIDVITGTGLSQALEGVDIAIDVSAPMPADDYLAITDTLTAASRNIVGACASQGVQRLVVLTIAGADKAVFDSFPYYVAKRAAEDVVLSSPVPATIVKSTHCHEFATNRAVVTCNEHQVVVQDWLIQPIAADSVADVLVEAALGQTHTPRTITGPHGIRLPLFTAKLLALQGDYRRVRAVPPDLEELATGALLAPDHAVVIGPDVETWLHAPAPTGTPSSTSAGGGFWTTRATKHARSFTPLTPRN
ncbi:SDR family oxidoreductase [Mycobacterium haemophilum]|uniref:SDR family oxidoreductase n=1 Tax=Mycobacterium haemophilum TaxID=29311 RepID=UPI0009EAC77F|nr:NAD(P)H-binding protein [Mycobacterium haemophilum]MCV7340118.1 NAD(P)H-binding protein [Mycobacterium haemophilum DSM 44634]